MPGGLAAPGGATAGGGTLALGWLVVLAFDDALIALLLGYRLAVVRYGSAADAARSALTYAIVDRRAAGATRAIDVPRLLGPASLTLVFYLWDALHGTAPARRREPRFVLGAGPARRARRRRHRVEPPARRLSRPATGSGRRPEPRPFDASTPGC